MFNVKAKGPVFDGRAERWNREFTGAAVERIAREGKNNVVAQLNRVLKVQTPYYITRIRTDRQSAERWLINDGPHTFKYGPWLEGTGSRNFPITSFRGYRTFSIIRNYLYWRKQQIAERLFRDRFLDRMNGR